MHRRTSSDAARRLAALSRAARLAAPFGQAPAIVTPESARPALPCGVATGDVTDGQAIVWSRTDRPARLIVEYSTSPSFTDLRRVVGPAAMESTDFTARVDLSDLPPGQRISYRVLFQDLVDLRALQRAGRGQLPDAGGVSRRRSTDRDVSFAFSGDCVGQGWGIDLVARRHASVRRDAAAAARRLHPPRRHDLRRPAAEARK